MRFSSSIGLWGEVLDNSNLYAYPYGLLVSLYHENVSHKPVPVVIFVTAKPHSGCGRPWQWRLVAVGGYENT